MSEPAVILEGVSKGFAGLSRPALTALSGRIQAGMISGVVGPDGAGKTTLLRLMAGLLKPDAGGVRVFGRDPAEEAGPLRMQVGYMPQKFALYEDLTVLENLALHADLRAVTGADRERAFARLLEFTDLNRFTRRMAGKLSGGMKQKLGLACSLLGRPRLLLLDEPGVGVDPISRRELWAMVQQLAREGIAVVWSTAYLEEAESCDEVLLLNEGRLLFDGKPGAFTARLGARSLHLRGLAGCRRRALRRVLKFPEVSDGVIQGRSVRVILREGAKAPDPAGVDDADGSPYWVPVEPRFEDAFIDLLGGGPGGGSRLAERMRARAPTGDTLIEAESLTKRFGDFAATDRVSFSVKQGEIFGLLGPNGAGKSTTFKMMCGLLTPTAGRARVMGLDLQRSAGRARQRLGYMAQKFSLYGNLSVRGNLEFFSGIYGLHGARQRAAIASMLEAFHLEPFLEVRTDSLSPGFKQRLALACAVMHEPDILFLDEPTSGVDPVTRREFWSHINGVVERGVTVMVTTHFMDEAEYCDRIGLVYRGRLVAMAPPDELKAAAATDARPDPTMEDAFIELIRRHDSP